MNGVILATVLGTTAIARAQPAPADPSPPGNSTGSAGDSAGNPAPTGSPAQPAGSTASDPGPLLGGQTDAPADPYAPKSHRREVDRKPINFPEVLTTPTGWLLPAGVLYSNNALDTGGGVTSDNRVGLGDVAEFGIATTDQVRERTTSQDKPEQIQPYVTASFRLGIDENRLFPGEPGVTLGFRKSFERNHHGQKTRIAELTLVASKHLGDRVALHAGGALWDASLQSNATVPGGQDPPQEITLHGHGLKNQVRVFGGFEARPLAKSEILIDLGWAPEFCYQCDTDKIRLRPELSWGVRYEVASFLHIESGVRVPDIGNSNLLDAQIFGQVTFTSFALKSAVESLK
ncbi:MAG TPA: hypothetical protein VHN14_28725 [Kofleriaceae bacterium]|nr:hypothetical protein [Kofleriaceae bacterium]